MARIPVHNLLQVVQLHTSIYVLYSTTTVLYVYFVPYVQYTVPVLSYYTNRVRPCHPICRLALLPVIFFVQLYSTVVLYTGILYRLVLYISAFYVAQANEPVSIYAQNLRCTCNSMPLRDENDGTEFRLQRQLNSLRSAFPFAISTTLSDDRTTATRSIGEPSDKDSAAQARWRSAR